MKWDESDFLIYDCTKFVVFESCHPLIDAISWPFLANFIHANLASRNPRHARYWRQQCPSTYLEHLDIGAATYGYQWSANTRNCPYCWNIWLPQPPLGQHFCPFPSWTSIDIEGSRNVRKLFARIQYRKFVSLHMLDTFSHRNWLHPILVIKTTCQLSWHPISRWPQHLHHLNWFDPHFQNCIHPQHRFAWKENSVESTTNRLLAPQTNFIQTRECARIRNRIKQRLLHNEKCTQSVRPGFMCLDAK